MMSLSSGCTLPKDILYYHVLPYLDFNTSVSLVQCIHPFVQLNTLDKKYLRFWFQSQYIKEREHLAEKYKKKLEWFHRCIYLRLHEKFHNIGIFYLRYSAFFDERFLNFKCSNKNDISSRLPTVSLNVTSSKSFVNTDTLNQYNLHNVPDLSFCNNNFFNEFSVVSLFYDNVSEKSSSICTVLSNDEDDLYDVYDDLYDDSYDDCLSHDEDDEDDEYDEKYDEQDDRLSHEENDDQNDDQNNDQIDHRRNGYRLCEMSVVSQRQIDLDHGPFSYRQMTTISTAVEEEIDLELSSSGHRLHTLYHRTRLLLVWSRIRDSPPRQTAAPP